MRGSDASISGFNIFDSSLSYFQIFIKGGSGSKIFNSSLRSFGSYSEKIHLRGPSSLQPSAPLRIPGFNLIYEIPKYSLNINGMQILSLPETSLSSLQCFRFKSLPPIGVPRNALREGLNVKSRT